jgi:hypothetical protein
MIGSTVGRISRVCILPKTTKTYLVILVLTVVLAIYSYPFLATTATLGSRVVPPFFAPDLSLYLNLSNLQSADDGKVVNPYYGCTVDLKEFGYLKFRAAFQLFGLLEGLLRRDLWTSVLIWNLLWWTAIALSSWWLLTTILPAEAFAVIPAGLPLLLFFNFGASKQEGLAWLQLPSLTGFYGLNLPYIRAFFPQVPIALLLLYVILQIKATGSRSWHHWIAMYSVQLIALASFPYATLMMAGISAVGLGGWLLRDFKDAAPARVGIYAIACALTDATFVLHGFSGPRHMSPLELLLPHLGSAVSRAGTTLAFTAVLTVSAALARPRVSDAAKWSVVGLGISNTMLLLGDALFAAQLQLSHHAGYFVSCTLGILLTYLGATVYLSLASWPRLVRVAVWLVGLLSLLNGALLARAAYERNLEANRATQEFAQIVGSFNARKSDLVVAPAEFVDDPCGWIPLLTESTVLYCKNAQIILDYDQRHSLHRFRQALYLYFAGRDSAWAGRVISTTDGNALGALALFDEAYTSDSDARRRVSIAIRKELVPLLSELEQGDNDARQFFRQYKHVFVIEDAESRLVRQRLTAYLSIESEKRLGGFSLLTCTPL